MAKATTHPTCTPTNLNIRTRSSTLYANAPILLASILLNFRRRPESHLQLQVSEKFRGFKNSRTQELKDSRTQGLKDSRTQGLKDSRTQGLKDNEQSRAEYRIAPFLTP